ncbi:MAG: double-strand break repair helicase AddA [Pseudomonadota bacterium]
MNDASRAQIEAATPDMSTWLSANAGSGKTRVLTDRVARLLLAGVPPERILCLTYTKAAAMEMQNRLFQRLGEWAMLDDAALRAALEDVGEAGLSTDVLARARTLFARAIEAPGGLKIQTIHSFCSSVLRRFPLEAGVAPGFTEIDERVQLRLIADVLDQMAEDPARQDVIDGLVAHLSDEDGVVRLAQTVAGKAEELSEPWSWAAICDWAGIDPGLDETALVAQVCDGSEADLATRLIAHLDLTKSTQASLANRLRSMPWDAMTLSALSQLEAACLTMSGVKAGLVKPIANAAVRDAMGEGLVAKYHALAERVEAARPLRLALMTARRTHALHAFAAAFLPTYAEAKQARGWLDFDDLIMRTKALLTAPGVAQWVLFRLDGGIDHILVDEAQDTSPAQWQIVAQLAEDFAAGEGARTDVQRTIFVVGDKKQSIYSFQGADPEGFDRMRGHFEDRLGQIKAPFQSRELVYSFRSAPPILELVDQVAAKAGETGVGPDVTHQAFFGDKPGRVDLWPVVEKGEVTDPPDWDDPQDLVGEDHHVTRLAQALADRIDAMIKDGEPVVVEGERRAVTPGDILILVQRRSPLFRAIISALKVKGLPIAGVDRAQIAEPLAVQDLLALMRFLATPEDDLSLACVLRSPLGGWDEAELFDLAHGRGTVLWRALQERRDRWPDTVAMLEDLRDNADFLRPYDLLERALIRHDGRRRLIARLGAEAEDGIDAMLAQALAYERMEVPSLTGFVGWLETGEVVVKRDLAQARGQIRVMTVHGAKGLEAPVVILPDTGVRRGSPPRQRLVQPEGGPLVWSGSKAEAPEGVGAALDAIAEADAAERNRLLYVAMTRAENWLIVAASGDVGKTSDASWYNAIADGMAGMGASPYAVPEVPGEGLRIETGNWAVLAPADRGAHDRAALPDWVDHPAPRPTRDRAARTPSDLGGAKALPGEGQGLSEAEALRRGRLVHLLLEHLPHLPDPAWPAAAPGIAAMEASDVSAAELAPLLEEATRVLTAPGLASLFTEESLAEVELVGDSAVLGCPMIGIIDRLIVEADRVLAVDFKSNQIVPDRAEDVPEGLLRQMGAYAEMLAAIYPARRIETAILWSRTGHLMALPAELTHAALVRAAS